MLGIVYQVLEVLDGSQQPYRQKLDVDKANLNISIIALKK
jgi:hypothetical protein